MVFIESQIHYNLWEQSIHCLCSFQSLCPPCFLFLIKPLLYSIAYLDVNHSTFFNVRHKSSNIFQRKTLEMLKVPHIIVALFIKYSFITACLDSMIIGFKIAQSSIFFFFLKQISCMCYVYWRMIITI